MGLKVLLHQRPLLRQEDLHARHPRARSAASSLAYHQRKGHLVAVRRGLHWVVPPGADPETCAVDPYLLTGYMTDDAVVAYHSALELHGKAHSTFERFYYLTKKKAKPTLFRAYRFEPVQYPTVLRKAHQEDFALTEVERSGLTLRVTSLERTLVDLMDRPDFGGGWEEIWRSLESVEYVDAEKVVAYALLLDNATTAAKVGYFLDAHRAALMVEEHHLRPLKKRRPRQPHYLDRRERANGKLQREWNLIVPTALLERSWEEPR